MESDRTNPAEDEALSSAMQPSGRSIGIRLAALAILFGVAAIFYGFPSLIREFSRATQPFDASQVTIDAEEIGPELSYKSHGVDEIDGATFIVIRVTAAEPEAAAFASSAPSLRASLQDEAGEEFGWQLMDPSPGPDADRPTTIYRLRLPSEVRPAVVALSLAP